MNKPLLIAGIQPTNRLTLGNYLGAIKPIIKEQDNYKCYLFVADLHALTIPLLYQNFKYQEIEEFKWNVIKMYCACGIDLDKTKVFIQSNIKEHLELFYFLLTHTGLGELKRMTQYKHLSKQFTLPNQTEMSLMGLLIYPVLMASDILIYDADYVAVGEDQTQHLELTINIAERINNKYKRQIFTLPKPFNTKNKNKSGIKIKDLQNPEIKMSKNNKDYSGVIFLDDNEEDIKQKIMSAKTDSLNQIKIDAKNQPGITNLLEIYAAITNISIEEAEMRLQNNSYRELKEVVSELIIKELKQIQKQYKQIDMEKVKIKLKEHTNFCKKITQAKLNKIKSQI